MVIVHASERDFMVFGLEIVGFTRWKSYNESPNVERFRSWYRPSPKISKIWSDLQTTMNMLCRVASDANPFHLLLALRFLKAYPTETELAGQFQRSNNSAARKWSSFYVKKIQLPSKV